MKLIGICKFYWFFTILISTLSYATDSDSIVIKGSFNSDKLVSKLALYAYTSNLPLLEKKVTNNQNFRLALPATIAPGVYYLVYNIKNSPKVNIIINGVEKNIVLELKQSNYKNYPIIIESNENKKWYDYLTISQPQIERLESLFEYFSNFQDQIYNKQLVSVYQKERNKYYKNWSNFIRNNTNTLAGILVLNEPYYFSNLRKKPVMRDFLRRAFFWEGIDTNNSKLINTQLYTKLINNYLLYVDDIKLHHPFTEEEKQIELKKSVVEIIKQFSKNSSTKQFAIECIKQHKLIKTNKILLDFVNNFYQQR